MQGLRTHPDLVVGRGHRAGEPANQRADHLLKRGLKRLAEPGGSSCCYRIRYGTQWSHPAQGRDNGDGAFQHWLGRWQAQCARLARAGEIRMPAVERFQPSLAVLSLNVRAADSCAAHLQLDSVRLLVRRAAEELLLQCAEAG